MTSPALRTTTVSPGRTSFSRDLVLVVEGGQQTVEPPTKTGSSTANGVALPVRPIDTTMSRAAWWSLLGGELVGDGPAGRPGGRSEPALEREVVDLDHHPVDLVVEVVAVLLPPPAEGEDVVEAVDQGALGVDREAGAVQPGQGVGWVAASAPAVGPSAPPGPAGRCSSPTW